MEALETAFQTGLKPAPNAFVKDVFNWREGGFYACGMGLSTNFCIFVKKVAGCPVGSAGNFLS
ncbi:hypothetical protein B5F76_13790 [Desulfovibrio sp. An276]|nr:hypothetical protein B5F76_13790 [Desulfovibrio sp. An276]